MIIMLFVFFFFFFFSSRRRHTRLTCDWSSDRVLFRSSDVRAKINATVAGVGHTFDLFGKLALISAAVPYVTGEVSGNVGEDRRAVTRSGLADSRLKIGRASCREKCRSGVSAEEVTKKV